jgi:hypothetical protein
VCDDLAKLEQKRQDVRDIVSGIAHGYDFGLYLYGSGGTGKSHTVTTHLDQIGASYRLFNSRMTAKGLFMALEDAPEAIHVLEDMERITLDKDAQGVLRSALWAQPDKSRRVTWVTAKEGKQAFTFDGGIIMIANTPLAEMAELKALGTRINVHEMEVTEAEVAAFLRDMASQGYRHKRLGSLSPAVCLEVVEFVIDQCCQAGFPLDMRLYQHSMHTYLQCQSGHAQNGWRQLVANRVRQSARHRVQDLERHTREGLLEHERDIVREILETTSHLKGKTQTSEQVRLFKERTGGAPATWYRRKAEVRAEDSREAFEDNEEL